MSQTLFREPQIEEAPRNLILQNRCGNRLSLLFHEREVELDLNYKPNAFRRKDLAARTFSGRDVWTNLFAGVRAIELGHGDIAHWGYDPFCTELGVQYGNGARNRIRIWNLPEENAFVISARAPLTLVFRPHRAFSDPRDGLFTERFADRGEEITSFVAYPSRQLSRLRELSDGSRVVQLLEDDLVVIGGEENPGQVERLLAALAGLTPDQLTARVEAALVAPLAAGRVIAADPDLQRVLDLNRRVVWSGLDAGGACFGALNRIYHLIWVRDGSMTSAHMAQSGNPAFIRTWAPFLLANPSRVMAEDGTRHDEFGQIVGTRWSKAEDDGLFYATWSAFTHWQATGDDALIAGPDLPRLIGAIERILSSRFDASLGLMGSDTLGEESLHSSPYFAYDVVNGSLARFQEHAVGRKTVRLIYSLYHQSNTINVLLMACALLAQRRDLDGGRCARWLDLASLLTQRTRELLLQPDGTFATMILRYADGSDERVPFGPGGDFWEPAWAVSQGPFFPWPDAQLTTAVMIVRDWSSYKAYGFCPWNSLARTLHEHGQLPTGGWRAMLDQQLREALMLTNKYPMIGALTEYQGDVEGWRGLPFSAGSLMASSCAQLLRALPQGVAVRGGSAVQAVTGWRWRLSRIDAHSDGMGEDVAGWSLDGERFAHCLQVPEDRLRAGGHAIAITRGVAPGHARIEDADGSLIAYRESGDGCTAIFRSAVPQQVRIRNCGTFAATAADGSTVAIRRHDLAGTPYSVLMLPAGTVTLRLVG